MLKSTYLIKPIEKHFHRYNQYLLDPKKLPFQSMMKNASEYSDYSEPYQKIKIIIEIESIKF